MTSAPLAIDAESRPRYRLGGIEREGIAQLSLLETALWPLQGGRLLGDEFASSYAYTTATGRKQAHVTMRAALGLEPIDELVLWGLLGATFSWKQAEPMLLATPYWMLRSLGLQTGGSQYAELRQALVRLALASYQNDAFYNPETREHEYAAFQFLSILLPTVGGEGTHVDNERCWRIEWNPAFFRFARATGGNLLFDLDLYRALTPAARRLFLKLKDRFWRSKRVFLNVEDLTVHGLGFAADRPLRKRKYDLTGCMQELLESGVIALGRGHNEVRDLFLKRGKGSYVVVFYEGEYFRRPPAARVLGPKNAIADDPLYEPLRKIGVDEAGIRRLLKGHGRGLIQRWVRITDAAMHERPRGFAGFKVSPAAYLIDGVQNQRTPPDWLHAHEKRREKQQWEQTRATVEEDSSLGRVYRRERDAAWQAYLASADGQAEYQRAFAPLLELHKRVSPHHSHEAARTEALARLKRLSFRFPEYADWALTRQNDSEASAS